LSRNGIPWKASRFHATAHRSVECASGIEAGDLGTGHGYRVPASRCRAGGGDIRIDFRARAPQELQVNVTYVIGALVAGALLVYLVVAMLAPEWFE
jgi:K+-transporting ATPase KdpF subunit